jgi:hypothetical protein
MTPADGIWMVTERWGDGEAKTMEHPQTLYRLVNMGGGRPWSVVDERGRFVKVRERRIALTTWQAAAARVAQLPERRRRNAVLSRARMTRLSPERRSEIARAAARARWRTGREVRAPERVG